MRKVLVLAAAGALLIGCSSEPSDEQVRDAVRDELDSVAEDMDTWQDTLPTCTELVGEVVAEDDWANGCRTERDSVAASANETCADGRVLRWNDGIIGFDGEPVEAYTTDLLAELSAECQGS